MEKNLLEKVIVVLIKIGKQYNAVINEIGIVRIFAGNHKMF